jgi:hypothetical protein
MVKTAKTKTVLRSKDFPLPKKISDEDFDLLCKTYSVQQSKDMKRRLDELVNGLADWMREEQPQPRGIDRKVLRNVLSKIGRAATQIKKLGLAGRAALTSISPFLAPMLAAQWINERFPDDVPVPQSWAPPENAGFRGPIRQPMRARKYFIEEQSRAARFEFVRRRSAQTLSSALKEIESGLGAALRSLDLQPGSRGGRSPLTYRHYLIINLAEMWDSIGKRVSAGPRSDFPAFCISVAENIGWPDEGMAAAVGKAVPVWRNLSKKK